MPWKLILLLVPLAVLRAAPKASTPRIHVEALELRNARIDLGVAQVQLDGEVEGDVFEGRGEARSALGTIPFTASGPLRPLLDLSISAPRPGEPLLHLTRPLELDLRSLRVRGRPAAPKVIAAGVSGAHRGLRWRGVVAEADLKARSLAFRGGVIAFGAPTESLAAELSTRLEWSGVALGSLRRAHYEAGVVQAWGELLGGQLQARIEASAEPEWLTAEVEDARIEDLFPPPHRHPLGLQGRVDLSLSALRADAQWLHARGRLRGVSVDAGWLAEGRVALGDLEFEVVLRRQEGRSELLEGRFERGGARLHAEASLDARRARLRARLDPIDCARAFAALPAALLGPYAGARLEGRSAPELSLDVPLDRPFDLDFALRGFSRSCRVSALQASAGPRIKAPAHDAAEIDWLKGRFALDLGPGARPRWCGPRAPGYVRLSSLPRPLRALTWLSEEAGFRQGLALSPSLIRRALRFDLDRRRFVYGGSTLTQQLAKNLFLDGRDRTMVRKLRELLYALELERTVGKERILELYLNIVELGPHLYGVGPAADAYFIKTPDRLTPREAAFLAVLLPSPRRLAERAWLAGRTPDARIDAVLDNMVDGKALTRARAEQARRAPLRIVPPPR